MSMKWMPASSLKHPTWKQTFSGMMFCDVTCHLIKKLLLLSLCEPNGGPDKINLALIWE